MHTDQWETVQELFERALALEREHRDAFLEEACAGDVDLRREIQSLLANHDKDEGMLDAPAVEFPPRMMPDDPTRDFIGKKVGGCVLQRVLGSGGMSVVFLAQQQKPQREVAVKFMKAGLASRTAMRRFEFESNILARLKHPNIAQVYGVGTHHEGAGSIPYFVMEYIPQARSITVFAEEDRLDVRQRLKLFIKVCDAVHHGHQKGIIHRDLKPGNILVDAAGEPKVIDFGVARATDSDVAATTMQTDLRQLIGTLQYMSPEQCGADPNDLDIRSDVYALGVVLYEVLCGRPPYNLSEKPVYEAARVIQEHRPARPSSIDRALKSDLETITLTALKKDRDRRYQSADQMARDIERYLNDEPIAARPLTALYRARMFTRRNKVLVGAVVAVMLTLLVASAASLTLALRVTEASRFPNAMRALFSSELYKDYAQVVFMTRLAPAYENSSPAARNLIAYATTGSEECGVHGVVMFFNDDGEVAARHRMTIDVPPSIREGLDEQKWAPIKGATVADMLPDSADPQIIVAKIYPGPAPSCLALYDMSMAPLARVWHYGHIQSLYYSKEHQLLVFPARSNLLLDAVPALKPSRPLWEMQGTNPSVLVAIRAGDIPRGDSVLFPLDPDEDMPMVSPVWILTREHTTESVAQERATRRRFSIRSCSSPDSDHADALCRITISCGLTNDEERPHNLPEYFHGHLTAQGKFVGPLIDEQGRRFTEVTGLPEPRFMKIDLPQQAETTE